jgi:uncharacterized damage-inducible protein DinB
MEPIELIILNFEEVRRRSIKLWTGITPDIYFWKPDEEAMSFIEMVRHVLESEHFYNILLNNRGNIGDYPSPWEGRPYTTLQDELDFAKPYREKFLETVRSLTAEELDVEIIRSERGQRRRLGDYLLRFAYHESVHTGQLLSYFRTVGLDRPMIWD